MLGINVLLTYRINFNLNSDFAFVFLLCIIKSQVPFFRSTTAIVRVGSVYMGDWREYNPSRWINLVPYVFCIWFTRGSLKFILLG